MIVTDAGVQVEESREPLATQPDNANLARAGFRQLISIPSSVKVNVMKQTIIEIVGGEDRLRKLVNDFYDLIETMPEGENIKKLHVRGHGLAHVREEQFNFLSGFLGGRRYYKEKWGHMDVKLMHAHVPISKQDAENWLICMDEALKMNGLSGPEIDQLRSTLRRLAFLLVNNLDEWGIPRGLTTVQDSSRT